MTSSNQFPPTSRARSPQQLFVAGLLLVWSTGATACHRQPSADTEAPLPRSSARASAPALLAQQLLDADRGFARQAVPLRFPEALAPMFSSSVRMPVRDRVLTGIPAVLGAFTGTPDTGATVHWTPVRAGLSADGQHGFTAGVQHVVRANGTRVAARYLAYWVRDTASSREGRWLVVAWRRRPLSVSTPDTGMLPAVLPATLVPIVTNTEARASHYRTLIAAEQGFSDDANRIGVGAAFAQLGDPEAINMGGPTDTAFARGPAAIAALVAGGAALNAPSTIRWNADTALVASSGDLGITFGVIRPHQAPANGAPAGAAFFTIWRKSSRDAPWRYVAE